MHVLRAALYIVAIILLVIAAFGVPSRVSLVCLAGASALLAFSLPVIAGAG